MADDLTPLQKFDKFLQSKEEDAYKWTLERVYREAGELGYGKDHVDKVIAQLRVYYHNRANQQNLKNRKHWARSIMKNLAPKIYYQQSARLNPSKYE